jgi:hypothetical protein
VREPQHLTSKAISRDYTTLNQGITKQAQHVEPSMIADKFLLCHIFIRIDLP